MIDHIRGSHWIKNKSFEDADAFHYVLKEKNVYEVIRIMEGKPLFLKEHLDRMKSSLDLQSMTLAKSHEEIRNLIEKLVKKNGFTEGNIKLFLNGTTPTELYLYFIPHRYPQPMLYDQGILTKTLKIERKNPNAKVIDAHYKKSVTDFIQQENIYEALIVNQKNEITEGSKSNVFFVKDHGLITPPLKDVLGGVTRHKVIELARKNQIKVEETSLTLEEIKNLEGAFISGTSPNILPIRQIDDQVLTSSSHPLITKLMEYLKEAIQEEIHRDL